MNKMIKGSLAGATGIALLMGGFGTYALWSDSEQLDAESITSGVLDIEAGSTTWSWAGGAAFDPANDLVVPGDVVVSTQTFDIEGTGTNLSGVVTFNPGSLSTGEYQGWLTYDVEVTGSNDSTVVPAADDEFSFSAPFGQETLTAVVTYTFGDASGQQAQDATEALQGASITIAQN